MSDTAHTLTRSALNAMAAEVGTEAGPGATTKEFNRARMRGSGARGFRAVRGQARAKAGRKGYARY